MTIDFCHPSYKEQSHILHRIRYRGPIRQICVRIFVFIRLSHYPQESGMSERDTKSKISTRNIGEGPMPFNRDS